MINQTVDNAASQRDRRALILAAARKEFGARGFDGARVARIASLAGVNKQLIFYYFGSKAGLYTSVTVQAASGLHVEPPGSGPATETVRHAIQTILDALRSRPELVAAFVRPPDGRGSGAPEEALVKLESDLAAVISAGQGLGYFRDDADPRLVARQGVLLCVGFLAVGTGLVDSDVDEWGREVGETLLRRLAW